MTLNEYQSAAMRTKQKNTYFKDEATYGALGLVGEAAEVSEHIKKAMFHNHPIELGKIREELGDVLWYVAHLADMCNTSLETIAEDNIEKLKKRYPEGFSTEDSINRMR